MVVLGLDSGYDPRNTGRKHKARIPSRDARRIALVVPPLLSGLPEKKNAPRRDGKGATDPVGQPHSLVRSDSLI